MLATTCMQFYKLAKKEHVCSFMQFHNTHVGAAHKILKCLFDFLRLLWNPKAQITFKSDIIWVNFGKFREFSIHTKISLICPKMTETCEFKDTYSPQKEKNAKF